MGLEVVIEQTDICFAIRTVFLTLHTIVQGFFSSAVPGSIFLTLLTLHCHCSILALLAVTVESKTEAFQQSSAFQLCEREPNNFLQGDCCCIDTTSYKKQYMEQAQLVVSSDGHSSHYDAP